MKKSNVNRAFYDSVHYWIKHKYGKAKKCENKYCSGLSHTYEWALKKGEKYDYIKSNFLQMCHKCHKIYDVTNDFRKKMKESSINANRNHCAKGHEYTEKDTYIRPNGIWRTCRECHNERNRNRSRRILSQLPKLKQL